MAGFGDATAKQQAKTCLKGVVQALFSLLHRAGSQNSCSAVPSVGQEANRGRPSSPTNAKLPKSGLKGGGDNGA